MQHIDNTIFILFFYENNLSVWLKLMTRPTSKAQECLTNAISIDYYWDC